MRVLTLQAPRLRSAEQVPAGLTNAALDPIFGDAGGDLYFNFGYGNNGARVALDSQFNMQAENQNNDATQGLGMDYCTYSQSVNGALLPDGGSRSGSIQECLWAFDVANRVTSLTRGNSAGTDKSTSVPAGTFVGQFAIYVAQGAVPPAFTC